MGRLYLLHLIMLAAGDSVCPALSTPIDYACCRRLGGPGSIYSISLCLLQESLCARLCLLHFIMIMLAACYSVGTGSFHPIRFCLLLIATLWARLFNFYLPHSIMLAACDYVGPGSFYPI